MDFIWGLVGAIFLGDVFVVGICGIGEEGCHGPWIMGEFL